MTTPPYHDAAWHIVRRALLRDRHLKLLFGLLGAGLGGSVLYYSFDRWSWAFAAIGMILLLLSVRLLRQVALQWRPHAMPLLQLLYFQEQRIVWVYAVATPRQPFGVQLTAGVTVFFRLIDGTCESLPVPQRALDTLERALADWLPHATFGYSTEYEQWYTADPALLLQ